MIRSANDKNSYRLITLNNSISVLLVSAPNSELASAALAVNVGHFDDPQETQGLAHLLEHMLFLGTAKYPDPSEYQSFIRSHGGQNNAWTSSEYTNYFFSIENSQFDPALSRFSEFFISPCLDGASVAKEVLTVESEYRLKIKDENRRALAVLKETVNPAHPFSKFSVGNEQTLLNQDNQLAAQIKQFYHDNYCASKMKLVLCANLSLDQLEQRANQYFAVISNHGHRCQYPEVPLTLAADKNIKITLSPQKDIRKLTLNFSMPSQQDWYQSKPLSYIAYLLGHEGNGSLLSQLKKLGLANSLSAGSGIAGYNYHEFSVVMSLTEAGVEKIDTIIALVFQYVELIKEQGIDCWRYSEKHCIINAAFDFQEPIKPIDLASHLVINMFKYHDDHIVCGDYMMESFELNQITQCVELISPDNLRMILIAPDQATDRVARWYDTPYRIDKITPQHHSLWSTATAKRKMYLPGPNPFIVERLAFSPATDTSPIPQVLIKKDGLRLWHYHDNEFNVPKGHIYTAIDSDFAGTSARVAALCHLYVEMLHDDLAEMTYPAEIAGLHYDIYPHQAGLTMHVSGYTPKMFLFFEMLITQIRQRNFSTTRFTEIKRQLTISWCNTDLANPINRLFKGLGTILQPNQYPTEQLVHELESITLKELQLFISKLYKNVHLECYVQGDWDPKQVELLGHGIGQQISAIANPIEEVKRQLVNINNRGTLTREMTSNGSDSAVIIYLQSALADSRKVAFFSLFNHFVGPRFFNEIRTNQQLGYLCGSSYMPINRHPGSILYIQSDVASPHKLVNAIDQFLIDFVEEVAQLSDQEWQQGVAGLLSQIEAPDTSSRMRAHRHWLSIGNRDYQFNHRERISHEVKNTTQQDLSEFIRLKLIADNPDRLILSSYGENLSDDQRLTQGHAIRELPLFKRQANKFTL